jgi:3-phosphoshikimate 1-carboxyvinyltransferase
MNPLLVPTAKGPLDATVDIPGSKSLTNRAMIASALAAGKSVLSGALFADDTRRMIEALGGLGFSVVTDETRCRIEITGMGGHVPASAAELSCGNSGTTIRFCAALAALGQGAYTLDGVPRMRERPIGDLVDALRTLGALVEYEGAEGYPPITVHARGLTGGAVRLNRPPSSQFVSALLLVAPSAIHDVMLEVEGPPVSAPYIAMTTGLMDRFGVGVMSEIGPTNAKFIVPARQTYRPCNYAIEPDASNASYFLAAPAVAGGTVTVRGLGCDSVQGDVGFTDVLERMGCGIDRSSDALTVRGPSGGEKLRAIDVDLNHMPDMVQTVATLALFADGKTTIRNVGNLRLKETDRLAALVVELSKLGATVVEREDGLTIEPPDRITPATIATYDDHRMAMSFALVGLAVEGISIEDAMCVEKTFPDFFDRWAQMLR